MPKLTDALYNVGVSDTLQAAAPSFHLIAPLPERMVVSTVSLAFWHTRSKLLGLLALQIFMKRSTVYIPTVLLGAYFSNQVTLS